MTRLPHPRSDTGGAVAQGDELAGRTFHMMGIGGAGVSALAQLAVAWGALVTGCDRARSSYMQLVEDAGVPVAIGHDAAHVAPGSELIVSSAVAHDHPEVVRARQAGVPVRLRGELLGELTSLRRSVIVAGAHGKSTTTGMIVHVLVQAGHDPSMALGAELPLLGGNVRVGSGDWFVAEGDESDRTLEALHADIAVVTNIERDHHHTFTSDEQVHELVRSWVGAQGEGCLLVAGPGPELDALADAAPGEVLRYGNDEQELARIAEVLPAPGRHNALNAAAALAVCERLGVGRERGLAALSTFTGVGRRFDIVGDVGGTVVVDDYAHHPTEVAATIEGARQRMARDGVEGRVVVVFQPHLYSRTQALWREFAVALAGADLVFVLPIYAAREEPIEGVSASLIADELERIAPGRSAGVTTVDAATGDVATIVDSIMHADYVITMGAGDVTRLAPRLLEGLAEREHGDLPAGMSRPARTAAATDPPAFIEHDVPLHRFTTIGTGGPARWLGRVEHEQQLHEALAWAQQCELPVAVVGLGSNSLVVDEGFDGLALRLAGELARIDIDEANCIVTCGGGASLAAIVRRCQDAGLAGFEFACAIPGTVGGAVRMNAGAYGGEMADVLRSARVVTAAGARQVLPDDLVMEYRHTALGRGDIVSEARLQLRHDEPAQIRQRVKEIQARRSASQPRAARSFGSVFQNPGGSAAADDVPGAGALIERAGLKGHTIGGACISPKHGNFIENLGDARTSDIVALIELARRSVRERFGVTLQTEVHLLDRHGYRPLFGDGGGA